MRVAIVASGCHVHAARADGVSGHVLLALKTLRLLAECGHEVSLVTSLPTTGETLHPWVPEGVTVHHVGSDGAGLGRAFRLAGSWRCLVGRLREAGTEVVHGFGGTRTAVLLGALRLALRRCRLAWTLTTPEVLESAASRAVLSTPALRPDVLIASTSYVKRALEARGLGPVHHLPTGVPKPFGERTRAAGCRPVVLYWRAAARIAGVDTCVRAFERLSRERPHVEFVYAVRSWRGEPETVLAHASRRENVKAYLYPYPPGVTLEGLLGRATCAVFPFRRLSLHPQYAVLETAYAGVPVVASRIDGLDECVEDGVTGVLVPPADDEALASGIRSLLDDPALAARMGHEAARWVRRRWNWESYPRGLEALYPASRARRLA